MAERKTGPVKPPTIDLTARSADKDKPQAAKPSVAETGDKRADSAASASARTEAKGPEPRKPEPKKPAQGGPALKAVTSPLLAVGLAGAVAGGAIGLGAAYGLATLGYWPGTQQDTSDIAALGDELHSLYVKKSDIGGVVDRANDELRSGLDALDARIAALEAAPAGDTASPALDELTARVGTLETGLSEQSDKLDAAVIAGGDTGAADALASLSARMTDLSAEIDALKTAPTADPQAVATLQGDIASLTERLSSLNSSVDTLQSAPAPEPVDLRLPLALAGFAEALDTGVSFADELALIRAALPDLDIPETVAAAAVDGLGSPARLQDAFRARLPDMLAAKPADASAGWTDQVLDRLKALVALRPVAGSNDSPEGQVGAIEAALATHDYRAAATGFAALPEPMRAAAGGLDETVSRFAAAIEVITRARAEALTLAGAKP